MNDMFSEVKKAKNKSDSFFYFFEALGGYFLSEEEIGTYLAREKVEREVLKERTKQLYYDFFPTKYLKDGKKAEELIGDLEANDKELWAYLIGLVKNNSRYSTRLPEVKACSPFAEEEIWLVKCTLMGISLPGVFPAGSWRDSIYDYFAKGEPDSGFYLIVRDVEKEKVDEEDIYHVQSFEVDTKAL